MAPSRKSRSVNKRFSYINEVSSNTYGENVSRSKQKKRKFTDMLGHQWSKEELERFYGAYRKYGKDWRKVADAVRYRSVDTVEALYTMNRAYLSLPEGTASVVGLIAMMTDHYSVLGRSDSEQQSNEGSGATRRPQKQVRGKIQNNNSKGLGRSFEDVSLSQSLASSYGCLSLLKKRRSGIKPHAVGKRTPRVPVSYSYDKDNREKYFSPARQSLKLKEDANDDDVAHEIALVLTEASQRGGSPQLSQTPNQKAEDHLHSPIRTGEKMRSESEMTSTKLRCSEMDEGGCELSLGSTGADNADCDRRKSCPMSTETAGTVEVQQKKKKYYGKKREVEESVNNHLYDIKEACSGTEEGQKLGAVRGRFETEDMNAKTVKSSLKGVRKRSKKALFGGDEGTFDALQALADLSLMMPGTTFDTESTAKANGEDVIDKSKLKGKYLTARAEVPAVKMFKTGKGFVHNIGAITEAIEGSHQSNTGTRKRKLKSSPFKISKDEAHAGSSLSESQKIEAVDEVKKSGSKGKRSPHDAEPAKSGKLVKPPENVSSSTDHRREDNDSSLLMVPVPSPKQIGLPTKVRSRRKMVLQKPVKQKDSKLPETILVDQPDMTISSLHLKEKLSNCLSWYQVRRWATFEWFYSAIDCPWFAKCEFVEYLNHVGLGHVPRLTRVEWSVIRSSLGKPRRFSEQFMEEEKEKLNQYRESVRKHYAELRAGTREGLPTDLAQPLSVGQRVMAVHPRTKEIHDGSVLTVDYDRCRVQFDQPELGVEFVVDIDCMPLNPLENMPASLMKNNVTLDKIFGNLNELKMNGQLKEGNIEDYIKPTPSEKLEKADGHVFMPPSTHQIGKLLKQEKVDWTCSNLQARLGTCETGNIQQAANSQSTALAQFQANEADVQALSELTRALDKKEVVVSELRRMNDEASENQKNGDNSLKDSDYFKKQYAAVLLQLNEVNEQVSFALLCLRQRNTYQGNSPHILLKLVADLGDPVFHAENLGSHVTEIVESSRKKARRMVDAAIQAMSTMRKVGNTVESIEEVIDYVNNRLSAADLVLSASRSTVAEGTHVTVASQNQFNICSSTNHIADPKLDISSEQSDTEIPSELIAHCVATLLMIQKCTERQFPPADVAQVLDSAVNGLLPCCSQNQPICAEIQKCMGIIRTQILALIPT